MLAYSPSDEETESGSKRRGFYIATFWTIFNVGGLLGGFLQFGLNYSETNGNANLASYCVFIGVMLLGCFLALFCIVDPSRVVRDDGTLVNLVAPKSPREEFADVASVIFDRNMLMLSILFFGSNFFYTYMFDGVNGFIFNLRTRGLNSALYWAAQMVGAILIGWIVDNRSRWKEIGQRALVGFTVLTISVNVFYSLGCVLEYSTLRGFNKKTPFEPLIDFSDPNYVFPCLVFILYGLGDSIIQAFSYWLIGAIARDNAALCARYTGF
jgi:MFS family permease